MPQSATIKSLPAAFRMMKAMQAEDVEWGEDYRGAARQALAPAARGPHGRDDRPASRAHGRTRPGRPAQRLLPALAADRARPDRAGGAAHADLQRAQGGPGLRPPGARRRPDDPRLLRARPVDAQGGQGAAADPRAADQPGHGQPGGQAARCRRGRLPSAAAAGPIPGAGAGWRGAQAQDRRRRPCPAGSGGARPAPRRQEGDHRLPPRDRRERRPMGAVPRRSDPPRAHRRAPRDALRRWRRGPARRPARPPSPASLSSAVGRTRSATS